MSYIEPCCVGRLLAPMFKESEMVTFQTNGDVTLEKLLTGLSSLAGDELKITLVTPVASESLLRVVAWYFRRGWLKEFVLLTREDASEMVGAALNGYTYEAQTHESVAEGAVVVRGEKKTLVVCGEMLGEVSYGHRNYVAFLGKSEERLKELAGWTETAVRAARRKAAGASEATGSDGATEASEASGNAAETSSVGSHTMGSGSTEVTKKSSQKKTKKTS